MLVGCYTTGFAPIAKPRLRLRRHFVQGTAVIPASFMHPSLLAGLATAVLPVAIHLVGRHNAPLIAFAAFDFLQSMHRRTAWRERLRQWLLLALRAAALMALVVAVSRPTPAASEAAASLGGRAQRIAFVLDTSASMSYSLHGETLLLRAIRQAQDVLSHLGPDDAVTLVTTGSTGVQAQLAAPTSDHSLVRAALALQMQAIPAGVADLAGAFTQATTQLDGPAPTNVADHPPRAVFLLSDLASNSFAGLPRLALGSKKLPQVHLMDAAGRDNPPQALPNVAIDSVQDQIGSASGAAVGERRVVVRLKNWGTTAVVARSLVLCVDERVVVRALVDLAPGATRDKVLTYIFAQPGRHRLQLRLGASSSDGYTADDVWYGYAEMTPAVRILAVDGEPRATTYDDELYFLQRALNTVPAGEPEIAVESCTPEDLSAALKALPNVDVVVLAHLGRLTEAARASLQKFVEAGGGLLITLGRHTDFELANDQLKGLLPRPLRDLSQAADPGTPPRALGLTSFAGDHPILHGLGSDAEDSLRHSRTAQYFNLDVGAATAAQTLLAFDNGAPALIEKSPSQSGRVLLWTSSIDVDLSDLPLRTAFVPLMQRTVRYLAGALVASNLAPLRVPGLAQLALPAQSTALALISPSGQRYETTTLAGDMPGPLGPLQQAGYYGAQVQTRGSWQPHASLDIAVNARLDESDFSAVAPDAVQAALGAAESTAHSLAIPGSSDAASGQAMGRTWIAWLMGSLVLFVVAENFVAARG